MPLAAGELALLLREIRDRLPPLAASTVGQPQRLRLRVHRAVKEIEPWGILLAIVGLFLALMAFWIDYRDRVEERTVRAWQVLTTRAPGNSGKREALAYLNREDGLLCFEALRGRLSWLHGDEEASCLIVLKGRTPLTGIDLSAPDNGTPDDLSDDPPGAYLQGANLAGANLQDADLTGAYLQGANLAGADLARADLYDANLQDADLAGANLQGANLDRANLSHADLAGADLARADLYDANLQDADLAGANLQGANLDRANLSHADLAGANLSHAHLPGANLQDADLGGADLEDAVLTFAGLPLADLTGANLQDAGLTGANLQGANLAGASLRDANLAGADLGEADLTDALLEGTNFEGKSLRLPSKPPPGSLLPNRSFRRWGADPLPDPATDPARNLTQTQIDRAWAWADEFPWDLHLLDPPLALPMIRLCDPALRSAWSAEVDKRTKWLEKRYGPPAGCSGAPGAGADARVPQKGWTQTGRAATRRPMAWSG